MQNGQSAPQVRCLTPPFRGAQQDDPLTSQAKSHLSRRKGEVMTRHHLYWNRTHKGRNLWSKANYFHRYSLGEQQQYVMTMRLSKGVWFGIRPLSSVTSVQCSQFVWFITALPSRWWMTTMEGHSNAECEKCKNNLAGETLKAKTSHKLFPFSA